jgi:hypothetical protein
MTLMDINLSALPPRNSLSAVACDPWGLQMGAQCGRDCNRARRVRSRLTNLRLRVASGFLLRSMSLSGDLVDVDVLRERILLWVPITMRSV